MKPNQAHSVDAPVASLLHSLRCWRRATDVQRWARRYMKFPIVLCVMLISASAYAMTPDYHSSRKWVEQRCSTNATPREKRIFVGRIVPREYAGIIHFKKGITLREIIDQTPFEGTAVMVCVSRAEWHVPGRVFRVAAKEKPDYEIKALDMIYLFEDGPVLW